MLIEQDQARYYRPAYFGDGWIAMRLDLGDTPSTAAGWRSLGTPAGGALLAADRAERDAWLHTAMRENLTELEFGLLLLVAPVLRKLADAEAGTIGT